jgi:hypothetical protein
MFARKNSENDYLPKRLKISRVLNLMTGILLKNKRKEI